MKKIIGLTETDLSRIVKRVINEDMNENSLYSDIMGIIRNSNSSHEETLDILRSIVDEMESSRRVRKGTESRFRNNMNEMEDDLYSDSQEDINYDIKGMDCGEYSNDGHVDIDEDDTIVIRYCKGDEDKLDGLKRRGKKLLYSKYGM